MENKNLDKGLEIISKLIIGEEIGRNTGNASLYEEYNSNMEVYEIVSGFLKKMNLKIYEYNYTLFVCAGESNKIFGYSNEELKKAMGLRLNRELYLSYYIIYHILIALVSESGMNVTEYVRSEDIIGLIDTSIPRIIHKEYGIVINDMEENSLKAVALLWDELPMVANDDGEIKASKGSKMGYVKLVFNFLISQGLFVANEDRYYAKDRFYAIARNYYDDNRGRLLEIMTSMNTAKELRDATD